MESKSIKGRSSWNGIKLSCSSCKWCWSCFPL